jgi:hypothetical protein
LGSKEGKHGQTIRLFISIAKISRSRIAELEEMGTL